MNNPNHVGEIDETSPLVSVPSVPTPEDQETGVSVVLPFPVAGLPAGTPVGTGAGPVTL
jgi:hypothetical protein